MTDQQPTTKETVVVKIGGAADVDLEAAVADVARVARSGRRVLLVHGGSADATALGEALGHPPRFVTSPSGHRSRVTDRRTLEIFLMATAGRNRRIVSLLQGAGVDALGLSGIDGRALVAERKAAIRVVEEGRVRILRDDWTGRPRGANGALLSGLLDQGLVPVLAPVGCTPEGQPVNVDGDRAAAAVAGALEAEALVLLTGAPGILRDFPDPASRIPHVPQAELDAALELVDGPMKKKVLGAREALEAGLERVVISGASGESPLSDALRGAGTVLGADWPQAVRA